MAIQYPFTVFTFSLCSNECHKLAINVRLVWAYPWGTHQICSSMALSLGGDGCKHSLLVTSSSDPDALSSLLPTMSSLMPSLLFCVVFFYKHYVCTFVAIKYMKEVQV